MTNYHYRNLYEWQYERLCWESGERVLDVTGLSDFALKMLMNSLLKKLGCIPFTIEELHLPLA